MEYRVASLRNRTSISRMTSFTSTNSRCGVPFLKSRADPVDDFRRTGCVFDDSRRGLACLFHIGVIARKPAQAGIGVGDGGGNRLIHFVRERSGQLSHGGHPADACEIRLRLTQSPFSAIAGFLRRAVLSPSTRQSAKSQPGRLQIAR